MAVILAGREREALRADLLADRERRGLTDLQYAQGVLKISLNTFRKCIGKSAELPLRRQSLTAILSRAGLKPSDYGLTMALPVASGLHGGYREADYGYIAGRYHQIRRNFLDGMDIIRSVIDIAWNRERECLSFRETLRYRTDPGVDYRVNYTGDIYMHPDRVLMSLLAIDAGEVRQILAHVPTRRQGETDLPARTRGAVLTHSFPSGLFQPAVSAVSLTRVSDVTRQNPEKFCRTLSPNDEEYRAASEELRLAEEHGVVITPLLWRRNMPG